MTIDSPSLEELTSLAPDASYGDACAGDVRGQALHLSSVLPALSSAIGYPVPTAVHPNPAALQEALGFPQARSAIVVLVDGLGFWNLRLRVGHTPYLRSLMAQSVNARPISTCLPSTTTAAMGVFGTGTCPGLTAMAGYTQLNPSTGQLAQLIQFKQAPEPQDLQRQPTIFEQLAAQGVTVTTSGLPKFADSGLTRAALRGSTYISRSDPKGRIQAACQAAREPGLTYLYIRDIDKVGHAQGWDSEEWIACLERVDAQLAALKRAAPAGTLLVIVADHGMVQAAPDQRIDLADMPEITRGVKLIGGEPRQLMLYLEEGVEAQALAQTWQQALEGKALVRTREEAVSSGLFGKVSDHARPVIGDLLVSALGSVTLVDSRTQSDLATRLPGVHGSQTYLESDIPCLIDQA